MSVEVTGSLFGEQSVFSPESGYRINCRASALDLVLR